MSAPNRSSRRFLRISRRVFILLGWAATGQFGRVGQALLTYYHRYVPVRVKQMLRAGRSRAAAERVGGYEAGVADRAGSRLEGKTGRLRVLSGAANASARVEKTVSMVVLNREGAGLLDRFFAALDRIYTGALCEIIVVNHAAVDSSRDICRRWSERLPISLLACHENRAFSDSNNRAAEMAQGDLLLFANSNVVIPSDVISTMAKSLDDPSVGVVGIRQYEYAGSAEVSGDTPCHHLGVCFRPDVRHRNEAAAAVFRPFNLTDEKLVANCSSPLIRFPAATASFLMMRKADFLATGGFAEDYDYGYEDVDLCLKVRTHLDKEVVVVSDAYVLHQEGQTRRASSERVRRLRRITNDAALGRRFGYLIRRRYRERLMVNDVTWTGRVLTVAFAVADVSPATAGGAAVTARELAMALREGCGWDTRLYGRENWYRLDGVDVVIAMCDEYDPRRIKAGSGGLVRVAWAHSGVERWCARPWLGEFDLIWCSGAAFARQFRELSGMPASALPVVTDADCFVPPAEECARDLDHVGNCRDAESEIEEALELRREVISKHTYGHCAMDVGNALAKHAAQAFRIAVKVAVPNHRVAEQWGDYHFAHGLSRALKRRGHTVRVDLLDEWQRPESVHDDVVIVLRGLRSYQPRPDQISLMWNISHPDKVTEEEYQRFDHVFVAGLQYAHELAGRISVPVTSLLQCTDPMLFGPEPDSSEPDDVPAHPVLFVGKTRDVFRTIVKDAIAAGLDISVYGSGWEQFVSSPYLKGQYIPNHRLAVYYRRAGVVLNDHWNSMAEYGFISNRIFDAGACGAVVVSDEVEGMQGLFGGAVVTYRGAADLKQKVSSLLADEARRSDPGKCLQQIVLAAHTFDQRAAEILLVIRRLHAFRMLGPADPPLYPGSCTPSDDYRLNSAKQSRE